MTIKIEHLELHIPWPNNSPPVWWTWTEIVVTSVLVQIGLWTHRNSRGRIILLGAAWLILTTLWDKTSLTEMGLRFKNSKGSLWMSEPVLIIISLIWLTGVFTGNANDTPGSEFFPANKNSYIFSAFLQQLLMQSYVFVRLQKVCPRKAERVVALIFCASHLPNPALMFITLAAGWMSAYIFNRQRNLYALGLAHGLIGAAIATFWPRWVIRAGIGFINIILGSS
ncbi:MAG: CPBP family intramembrane metalloprotease [Candidatus Doudnabacteria bacterium]|nr:CPBP family intramembrane metalloprotease [Candidatus Doudnabacteria bacterium]